MSTHKHHIIPKHMGGSNDSSNIVELAVEEHAEAHRLLYELHGKIQDKVAWLGLAKLAPIKELVSELQRETKLGDKNPMYGKPAPNRGIKRPGVGGRKKGTKWTEKDREAQSKVRIDGYYDYLKTEERRQKYIGENNPMYGKTGANTGRKIYNNGTEEKFFIEGKQESGYILGCIAKNRIGNKKGLRWFNNGTENKQFREGQQPEGFRHGRIIKK